jgi:uncharacterized protein
MLAADARIDVRGEKIRLHAAGILEAICGKSQFMRTRLLPVLALLMLAGCASSPPTRFFALDAVPPAAPPADGSGVPVKIDAVHIPPALDRESMVRGESDSQLQISSQDRWAGDLGEMIGRVLTQDLEQRLPSGMVIAPQSPAPTGTRGVVVDILTFQPQAGEVVLDADWTLLEGTQSNPMLHRSVHLTANAATSAQDEAAAMSALLGQLADGIATQVQR